jgi:hypothetical protein
VAHLQKYRSDDRVVREADSCRALFLLLVLLPVLPFAKVLMPVLSEQEWQTLRW